MTQPQPPLAIPESMSAAEIGPYMRSIREYFKLSPQDVSERLHIRVRYVNAIEEGKFELMPGQVYARGYIHTYAEFLGLNPEQVTERCFKPVVVAGSTPVAKKETAAPKMTVPTTAKQPSGFFRNLWLPALILVLGLVVYTQMTTEPEEEAVPVTPTEKVVAAAPETLLVPTTTIVMPTADNYECLTGGDYYLTCFFAHHLIREMELLQTPRSLPFAAKIAAPEPKVTGPHYINLRDTSEVEREE